MATPPRQKGNSRPTARGAKPSTIDLDASDVKDTYPAAKAATSKTVPVTSKMDKPGSSKTGPGKTGSSAANTSTDPSVKDAKSTKTDPKPKSALPKPERNKNGFGRLAAAGIIGSVITLGGAGAMQYSGLLPGLGETPVAAPVVDLGPLQVEIETLQARLKTVEGSANQTGAPEVDLVPLENRIAKLENTPVVSGNSETGNSAEVEQLRLSLNDITASNEALITRLAALENSGLPLSDRSTITTAINSAIAPLATTSNETAARLQEIETRIVALTKKIDEDVDARINAFGKKLEEAATGEKLARSVAINALKSAIENGQPFSAALTSLETLAGPSDPLEKLKPFAVSGIATNKQLREEFAELQSAILRAATNDPDAGISQRLMASIQSLVTISSSEAISGDTPEAIISRINANLKSENFSAAISEWKALPEPAQQMSKAWASSLEQRMDADHQISQLLGELQSGN